MLHHFCKDIKKIKKCKKFKTYLIYFIIVSMTAVVVGGMKELFWI